MWIVIAQEENILRHSTKTSEYILEYASPTGLSEPSKVLYVLHLENAELFFM